MLLRADIHADASIYFVQCTDTNLYCFISIKIAIARYCSTRLSLMSQFPLTLHLMLRNKKSEKNANKIFTKSIMKELLKTCYAVVKSILTL